MKPGTIITIAGSGFPTNPSDVKLALKDVRGNPFDCEVIDAAAQLIQCELPNEKSDNSVKRPQFPGPFTVDIYDASDNLIASGILVRVTVAFAKPNKLLIWKHTHSLAP